MTNSIRSHDGTSERLAVGDRCGFYAAMSEKPLTPAELAKRTTAPIRFVQKWLANQVRDGYVVHEAASDSYANWCAIPGAA
jgi:hypothetical protein